MCTCITHKNGDFYFGRNMDLEYSFGECVVITPCSFPLRFRRNRCLPRHYMMIGMAAAGGGSTFPLYAEAVNEKGLCMAGLNFPGNAYYRKPEAGKRNIATFELIPWILGKCASIGEAEEQFRDINITDEAFAQTMPPAQLHWMLADKERCLVIESVREGVKIYDNPIGVLTNNPPFEYHRTNLNNYLNVTAGYPEPGFCRTELFPAENSFYELHLEPYSQGMGGMGLPGDFSSASRFVKAAFLKWNSVCAQTEAENVSQVFHILDSVAMPRGAVITRDGKYDVTTYSCCVNALTGVYYFKTYKDSRINAAAMHRVKPEENRLHIYPLESGQHIRKFN